MAIHFIELFDFVHGSLMGMGIGLLIIGVLQGSKKPVF